MEFKIIDGKLVWVSKTDTEGLGNVQITDTGAPTNEAAVGLPKLESDGFLSSLKSGFNNMFGSTLDTKGNVVPSSMSNAMSGLGSIGSLLGGLGEIKQAKTAKNLAEGQLGLMRNQYADAKAEQQRQISKENEYQNALNSAYGSGMK